MRQIRDRRIPRASLHDHTGNAWRRLYLSRNDQALVKLTGFDHCTFNCLFLFLHLYTITTKETMTTMVTSSKFVLQIIVDQTVWVWTLPGHVFEVQQPCYSDCLALLAAGLSSGFGLVGKSSSHSFAIMLMLPWDCPLLQDPGNSRQRFWTDILLTLMSGAPWTVWNYISNRAVKTKSRICFAMVGCTTIMSRLFTPATIKIIHVMHFMFSITLFLLHGCSIWCWLSLWCSVHDQHHEHYIHCCLCSQRSFLSDSFSFCATSNCLCFCSFANSSLFIPFSLLLSFGHLHLKAFNNCLNYVRPRSCVQ